MTRYSVTLKENDTNSSTYRVSRKIFDTLKKYLEPFRSYQSQAKKIQCVETGQIFNSAREASYWVQEKTCLFFCDMNLIKQACKGKQKSSYGFHWQFVEKQI